MEVKTLLRELARVWQQDIYDEMKAAEAALLMSDEHRMTDTLHKLLTDESALADLQEHGQAYAQNKSAVIDRVMTHLSPILKAQNLL